MGPETDRISNAKSPSYTFASNFFGLKFQLMLGVDQANGEKGVRD